MAENPEKFKQMMKEQDGNQEGDNEEEK